MTYRRIYLAGLVLVVSLLIGLSNWVAKPVYATYGNIYVVKKDTDGNPLKDWTFKLYKKNGYNWDYVTSKLTGSDGKLSFANVGYATYKVCEVVPSGWTPQYPTGADGCQTSFEIKSSSNTKSLTYVNKSEKRSIKFIKKEYGTGAKLSGWKIQAKIGSTLIKEGTTNSNGEVILSDLAFGNYTFCEVQQSGWQAVNPSNGCYSYTIDASTPTGTSAASGDTVGTQTYGTGSTIKTFTFENKKAVRSIKFIKKEYGTGAKLSGWKIQAKIGSTLIKEGTTNSNGEVILSDLPFGNYTFCEVQQSGWQAVNPSNGCYSYTIDASTPTATSSTGTDSSATQTYGTGSTIKTFTFENKKAVRSIKFIKKEYGTSTKLQGWTIQAKQNGTVIKSGTTNSYGEVVISDLPFGTYQFCEVMQTGWAAANPSDGCFTYTIDASTPTATAATATDSSSTQTGTTTTIKTFTFENKRVRSIKFIKKEYGTGAKLSGWKIQAKIGTTLIKEGTTDANGEVTLTGLPFGTYTFCEVQQSGWQAANPSSGCFTYTINGDTPNVASGSTDSSATQTGTTTPTIKIFTFENKKQVRKIKVVKKNESGTGLQNWQIKATNTATNIVYGPVTTNSSGEAYIDNLPFGTYNVCEIPQAGWAPVTGYAECQTITINNDTPTGSAQTSDSSSTQTYGSYNYLTVTFKNRQLQPKIDITKYTNDADANDANGSDVPKVTPGATVTWKYVVYNNGDIAFDKSKITVTDDQPGVTPVFSSVLTGDSDNSLEPGEKWIYTATGTAKTLIYGMPSTTVVEGCVNSDTYKRPTYENKGVVTVQNGPTDYDYSHYCNPDNPKIEIKKYTNGYDADGANGNDVPKISPDGNIIWTYVVSNTGNIVFPKAKITVVDNVAGGATFSQYLSGDQDEFLEPGERWLYQKTGKAVKLVAGGAAYIINGCQSGYTYTRPTYENKGTVTVQNGPSDDDLSHYCNPDNPEIKIKKYTNGYDADTRDGTDLPKVSPNGDIIWTYVISNTGNVPFAKDKITVVDNVVSGATFSQYLSGDQDNWLEPGERWLYQKTGKALDLAKTTASYVVSGDACKTSSGIKRPIYENKGTVTVQDGPFASDWSHYCNPETPGIDIKKYTNGADADNANGADVPKISVDGNITWRYVVSNTGNVPFPKASVVVTDNVVSPVTPVSFIQVLSGNSDDVLDPGERWLYQATGKALNLVAGGAAYIIDGCQTGDGLYRSTYENYGFVKITGYAVKDNDPSHYCNPEGPNIEIKKYTNGADADDRNGSDVPRISPDGNIIWTYVVSNTGNVPFPKADVVVTDNRGVSVSFDKVVKAVGDDTALDPGEIWQYKATGKAVKLVSGGTGIVNGCQVGENLFRPTYNNVGTVTVTDWNLTDTDPSHYCNPETPGVDIKKYTNGADADNANGNDVPRISPEGDIVWSYVVSNTGNVPYPKAKVTVVDNIVGGATFDHELAGNKDEVFDPGERWLYRATGKALTLVAGGAAYIIDGCQTGDSLFRPTYENKGTVTITGTDLTDYDWSHYCNPEIPKIEIKKYTNGADADDANGVDVPEIAPNGGIVWTYVVSNTGNVPFPQAKVVVTDNRGVSVSFDKVVKAVGDATSLDPGEIWQYKATGNALTLVANGGAYIVNGCQTGDNLDRPTYNNVGTVTVTGTDLTDNDPSHYCNPETPGIAIKKYTNGADADDPNGADVPEIAPNGGIVWTYVVSNTGNVPFPKAKVVVTDNRGVSVSFDKVVKAVGDDTVLDPGEIWQYKATGNALTLVSGGGDYIVNGCKVGENLFRPTYNNVGTVTVTGSNLTDDDPSHYCNSEGPSIEIKKYTNGADADDPNGVDVPRIGPAGGIVWTYVVSNTGNVPFLAASVVVTDNRGVSVSFDKVVKAVGDATSLDPGEIWQYKAEGQALDLSLNGGAAYVVNGCQTGQGINRPTYNNVGFVSVTGTQLKDNDPSHYCNPEGPSIEIKKYTNGADADDANGADVPRIGPNGGIIWTYVVSNTGNVPFLAASVVVTDNRGVSVSFDKVVKAIGDETSLDPGEIWQYKAEGSALNLATESGDHIVQGCKSGGDVTRPTYNNVGFVKVTGTSLLDSDPSHYCNPYTPSISIKKYTNGEDADTPTGPFVLIGSTVTWTYVVTNPGSVALSSVVVTDNISGVVPHYVSGDVNNDQKLDLTETWLYSTTGIAVEGQYANIGYTKGTPPEGPDVKDDDPSHYYATTPELSSLGDYVWHDLNANGIQEDGEPGVPDVTVNLLKGDCSTPMGQTDTTDGSGLYLFENLPAGNYCVEFDLSTLPTGYKVSPKDAGADDAKDSDGDAGTGKTASVLLPGGTQNLTLDLGIYKPASLGDRVWYDDNGNGVQDDGEAGVNGVTVYLYSGPECSVSMNEADETVDGIYGFGDLVPGVYCVQFDLSTLPTGYSLTTPNQGDDSKDSDADASTGKTSTVTLQSGDSNLTLDAGVVSYSMDVTATPVCTNDAPYLQYTVTPHNFTPGSNPVTIKWIDVDTNDVLYTYTGQPLNATMLWPEAGVDGNGKGNQWPGWTFSNGKWVDNGSNLRPTVKVEFSVNPVTTVTVTYPPSDPDCSTAPRAALGNRVWVDNNKNGKQDPGEVNVPNVKVTLYTCSDQMVGQPVLTGLDGTYHFVDLMPGCYYVVFDPTTLPEGYEFTNPHEDGVTGDLDSDPDTIAGRTDSVTLKNGDDNLDLDAGIFKPEEQQPELAALGDTVWYDVNDNGLQDNGELGVPGVKVDLYDDGDHLLSSDTTDALGKYLFTNLEPGSYYVVFASVTGYRFTRHDVTVGGNPEDELDSDAQVPWVDVTITTSVEAKLGKPLTYTVFYSNTDAVNAASNVIISTTVPTGTSFDAAKSDARWSCGDTTAGSVCTLTLATLAANETGSALFVVTLSVSEPVVPDALDIFVDVSQEVAGRSPTVTLAAGDVNLSLDAGIVVLRSQLTVETPTVPTNLPDDNQPGNKSLFLPTVHRQQ